MFGAGWGHPARRINKVGKMSVRWPSLSLNVGAAIISAILLAACQDSEIPKQFKPVPSDLSEKMRKLDMSETGPIFIRIYKESSELEVWKQKRNGKYALLKDYSICKWSGDLGPKIAEGDRQAPEGFYTVTPAQMNPNSNYYLSFNIGYPNAFDRALGRTGSNLMVHGACSSAGCYSMTDESAGELFALARDSFRGGQRAFQIQAFPFRMTPENMAKHHDSEHYAFWQMLKIGYDHFELTKIPPKVDVCDKRYVFDANSNGRAFSAAAPCPPYEVPEDLKIAVAAKQAQDDALIQLTVARLSQEAEKEAEDKRIAEEKRIAAEAEAARKEAAKEARAQQFQEKLGFIGRVFGRDKKPAAPEAVAESTPQPTVETPDVSAAAFAPAATPVPPINPGAKPSVPANTTSQTPAKSGTASTQSALPPPASPTLADVPTAQTGAQPTITQDMTPAIPSVGRFVKKRFLWFGDDGGQSQNGG